jgi:hypothetical protein
MRAFLGKATLIDQQATVCCSTQPVIRFLSHLIQDGAMFPLGLGEHVLQTLVIGSCNHFFHPFHVLSGRLHQTIEIVCGTLKY